MNDLNLLNVLSILSLFLGLLFALFLITSKAKNRLANRIFGVFLFFSAIDNILLSRMLHENYLAIGIAIALTVFLQLPLFYLYVKSVCYSDFTLKRRHALHAIPFVIANLLVLSSAYGVDKDSSIVLLYEVSESLKNKLIHIMIHLQVFSYLLAAFIVVRRSRKLYLENYANTSIPFYKWLMQLISVLLILHIFAVLKNIYKFSDEDTIYYWTRVALITVELLIFCWYVLKALNQPDIFKSVDSKLCLASNLSHTSTHSKESGVGEDTEVKKVMRFMAEEKPFLKPSFTLQQLGEQTQLPAKELSLLINHTMGKHFFDFVNEFRINEAKAILTDSNRQELTILEVLYEVGFNSKSSFNTAFKKYTGTTPTLYRKNTKKSLI
ncbi:hypothetical protein LCGC14_1548630 [marine sediment metagenome]|uniref:HTH araC/xylS-type domain-containing protein n=1 Tax=marine sediment metagenome TaxID=412755 RepID=A0A0F9LRW3_9ZZZZ